MPLRRHGRIIIFSRGLSIIQPGLCTCFMGSPFLSPEGTTDNNPAVHCRENPPRSPVPKARRKHPGTDTKQSVSQHHLPSKSEIKTRQSELQNACLSAPFPPSFPPA